MPNSYLSKAVSSSFLITFALILIITSLTLGNISLWDVNFFYLSSSRTRCLPLALAILATGLFLRKQRNETGNFLDLASICVSAWIIFFSDWLMRGFNYFQGPESRYYIAGLSLSGLAIILSCSKNLLRYLLPLASSVFIIAFFIESKGRPIFNDDHSVFFYRLQLLKDNFPVIPFFHPLWNAGIDQRDFFASGSLNFFTIFSPVIYLFDLAKIYNFTIAGLLFLICPYSTYFAGRLTGFDRVSSSIGAIFAMCLGLTWYRWGLKYGTVGFITSISLLPLAISSGYLVLKQEFSLNLKKVVLIALLVTLFLCWPLAGITIIPLLIYSLFHFKQLLLKKGVAALLILVLCLNVPWMTMFWSVSKVGSFVQAEKSSGVSAQAFRHESNNYSIKSIIKPFSETAISSNPLILFFGFFGLFFIADRKLKLILITESLWMFFLGTFGVTFKPQMELDRMIVVLYLILCLPAGLLLNLLIDEIKAKRKTHSIVLAALPIGFFLYSPIATLNILENKTVEHYSFQSNEYLSLREQLRGLKDSGGRILFTGCVIHELGNHHLAPLSIETGMPLMASSFVHNLWSYKQIFPEELLAKGDPGIKEYLDLYNVSHVFAHEDKWREYFYTRNSEYEYLGRTGKFSLYKRLNFVPDYFLQGKGSNVIQTQNSFRFIPATPQIVLKLNYFDFLKVTGCSRIEPEVISENVKLVKLSGCEVIPGAEVEIKMVNPVKRLFE